MKKFGIIICIPLLFALAGCKANPHRGGTGKVGSLARFGIVGNYLYTLSGNSIKVFSIKKAGAPRFLNQVPLAAGVETIFPHKGNLLLGSRDGMFIFSLKNPKKPRYISKHGHVRACDPVVAHGNRAYVTLRTGNRCPGSLNELRILSIKNIHKPKTLSTYPMFSPSGLALDGDRLFVCDGSNGLVILNVKNPGHVVEERRFPNIHGYDLILEDGLAIISARKGIFQYDVRKMPPRKLSLIPVVPKEKE